MSVPWSTQQLAEFLAAVSSAETEAAAAWATVERTSEALDAEVAAIVSGGQVLAAVGYPDGAIPVAELAAVAAGVAGELSVPGLGVCPAAAVQLEHPEGATLVVGRCGTGLEPQEASLLRGIAHASSTAMRMLGLLDHERAAREEGARRQRRLEQLVNEQAALRRVATQVTRAAPPEAVFGAVAAEVGRLFGADVVMVFRFEPERTARVVGVWSVPGVAVPDGARLRVEGVGVAVTVLETGRPARTDRFEGSPGSIGGWFARLGARSGVGAPISVEGRLWGAVVAVATESERLPAGSETRIAGFTELVATAIANAESQAQLTASRARIVAAADHARRRIERDLHDGAQQHLVSLRLRLRVVRAAVPPEAGELAEQLDGVAAELGGVLDELREIAHGLHPAALAEGGLRRALKTLARRSAVPVRLDVGVDGRLPEQIELAAYYLVAEALTNTAKHAQATVVDVQVKVADGVLRVRVRDDGRGGVELTRGSGLVGLKDRVETLGGGISLHSPPGAGTDVQVVLPLDGSSGQGPLRAVVGPPADTDRVRAADPAPPDAVRGS